MRGHYSWYVQKICDEHYIPITKRAYGIAQQKLLNTFKLQSKPTRPRLAPPNVRLPIKPRPKVSRVSSPLSSPPASVIDTGIDTGDHEEAVSVDDVSLHTKQKSPAGPVASGDEFEIESIQEMVISDDVSLNFFICCVVFLITITLFV